MFEASRGLMEVVAAVAAAVVVRGKEGKWQTREEGFGEKRSARQLCNALTVAAERARSYSVSQILTIKSL